MSNAELAGARRLIDQLETRVETFDAMEMHDYADAMRGQLVHAIRELELTQALDAADSGRECLQNIRG